MTHNANGADEPRTAPRRGFWGGAGERTAPASNPACFYRQEDASELDESERTDGESEGLARGNDGRAHEENQSSADAPSFVRRVSVGNREADEGEVPPWLKLSHVVDDSTDVGSVGAGYSSSMDSTAELPRLRMDDVVVRVPAEGVSDDAWDEETWEEEVWIEEYEQEEPYEQVDSFEEDEEDEYDQELDGTDEADFSEKVAPVRDVAAWDADAQWDEYEPARTSWADEPSYDDAEVEDEEYEDDYEMGEDYVDAEYEDADYADDTYPDDAALEDDSYEEDANEDAFERPLSYGGFPTWEERALTWDDEEDRYEPHAMRGTSYQDLEGDGIAGAGDPEEEYVDVAYDDVAEEALDTRIEATYEPFEAYADDNVYEQAVEDEMSEVPTARGERRAALRWRIALGAVAALLVVAYAVGVVHFSERFLPRTSVNGRDVSGLTMAEAETALADETASYACKVSANDFSASIAGKDISLERDEAAMVKEAKPQQSAFAWPIALFSPSNIVVNQGTKLNREVLREAIGTAVDAYNRKMLPTTGASIDYDDAQGIYVLGGTTTGEALDKDLVTTAALEGVQELDTTCTLGKEAFHQATVEDLPDYTSCVRRVNTARTSNVPLLLEGEQVATVEAWQNAQWVWVGDGAVVTVDEEAVRAFADNSLSYTVYRSEEWDNVYLDSSAFVEEYATRLSAGDVEGFEVPIYRERRREGLSRDAAYAYSGWNSELGRYIDVDLTAQFARLFDESGEVIWESAFVSGSMYEGHSTVTGVYEVYAKQTNQVLVGFDYDNDGKPDYESYVNYWMPFYGGYGLHDATWRYAFGGDLYVYGGSHGCINLPMEKAAELYDLIDVGETVNVYWEDED